MANLNLCLVLGLVEHKRYLLIRTSCGSLHALEFHVALNLSLFVVYEHGFTNSIC